MLVFIDWWSSFILCWLAVHYTCLSLVFSVTRSCRFCDWGNNNPGPCQLIYQLSRVWCVLVWWSEDMMIWSTPTTFTFHHGHSIWRCISMVKLQTLHNTCFKWVPPFLWAHVVLGNAKPKWTSRTLATGEMRRGRHDSPPLVTWGFLQLLPLMLSFRWTIAPVFCRLPVSLFLFVPFACTDHPVWIRAK